MMNMCGSGPRPWQQGDSILYAILFIECPLLSRSRHEGLTGGAHQPWGFAGDGEFAEVWKPFSDIFFNA